MPASKGQVHLPHHLPDAADPGQGGPYLPSVESILDQDDEPPATHDDDLLVLVQLSLADLGAEDLQVHRLGPWPEKAGTVLPTNDLIWE